MSLFAKLSFGKIRQWTTRKYSHKAWPNEQRTQQLWRFSVNIPACRAPFKTSGARWAGLPPGAIPCTNRILKSVGWSWTAKPKSQIFRTPSCETKMLLSFMSRWTTPCCARNFSASESCLHQLRSSSNCNMLANGTDQTRKEIRYFKVTAVEDRPTKAGPPWGYVSHLWS